MNVYIPTKNEVAIMVRLEVQHQLERYETRLKPRVKVRFKPTPQDSDDIECLGLTNKTEIMLRSACRSTVGDIRGTTESQLLKLRGFGKMKLEDVKRVAFEHRFQIGDKSKNLE